MKKPVYAGFFVLRNFTCVKETRKTSELSTKLLKNLKSGSTRMKLAFLGLSLLLWFLIKLSKGGYLSEVEFKVDYQELPDNKVFTADPPQSIRLRLQGTGFSLLKYAWFNYRSLDIDLSSLEQNKQGDYYWLSKRGKNFLESQINAEDTRLLDIYPDTLFFHISSLQTKEVPVVLQASIGFDSTKYSIYGQPEIIPSQVAVRGPKEYLDQIQFIRTQKIALNDIQDSMRLALNLEKPDWENLYLAEEEVQVNIQFSTLTEGKLSIPVLPLNLPDSLEMELFPSEIEIKYQCALRDFKDIRADEFFIYADYQEIANKPNAQFISLRYEQPPKQVRSLNLLTKRVEFILSKK